MPASLKKLAFIDENRPNSLSPFVDNFKQGRFFAPPHLFFGSPVNAAPICISRIHKNRTELSLSSLVKPDPEGQIGDTKPTESCLSE